MQPAGVSKSLTRSAGASGPERASLLTFRGTPALIRERRPIGTHDVPPDRAADLDRILKLDSYRRKR